MYIKNSFSDINIFMYMWTCLDYMHVVTEHNFSKEVDIMCQG